MANGTMPSSWPGSIIFFYLTIGEPPGGRSRDDRYTAFAGDGEC